MLLIDVLKLSKYFLQIENTAAGRYLYFFFVPHYSVSQQCKQQTTAKSKREYLTKIKCILIPDIEPVAPATNKHVY